MHTQTAQRSFVSRRGILILLLVALTLFAFIALAIKSYTGSEPVVSHAEPATPLVLNRPSDRPVGIANLPWAKPCVPAHVPSDRLDAIFSLASANNDCDTVVAASVSGAAVNLDTITLELERDGADTEPVARARLAGVDTTTLYLDRDGGDIPKGN